MKKSTIAIAAVMSLTFIAPVHAEEYPKPEHAEEFCPVVPPVIQTVYVDRPGPTVYVPSPIVTITPAPVTITQSVPQYVYTDKPQTIIDLAKAQYAYNSAMTAYAKMRAKYLALVAVEKKERK